MMMCVLDSKCILICAMLLTTQTIQCKFADATASVLNIYTYRVQEVVHCTYVYVHVYERFFPWAFLLQPKFECFYLCLCLLLCKFQKFLFVQPKEFDLSNDFILLTKHEFRPVFRFLFLFFS